MECRRIALLDEPFEADVKFVARGLSFGIFQFSKKSDLVIVQLHHCIAPCLRRLPGRRHLHLAAAPFLPQRVPTRGRALMTKPISKSPEEDNEASELYEAEE